MTIVDRHVDEAERVFLRQLRSLLDIEPEVATQIEQMFGSLPRRGQGRQSWPWPLPFFAPSCFLAP